MTDFFLLSLLFCALFFFSMKLIQKLSHKKILLHTRDDFSEIWIYDEREIRYLITGPLSADSQSAIDLTHPHQIVFYYQKMILTALLARPQKQIRSICIIGLGAGTLNQHLRRFYPEAEIVVVDINPRMIDYSKKYFGLVLDDQMKVVIDDGYHYLQNLSPETLFDAVIIDAFDRAFPPEHFMQVPFVQGVKQHLSPHGILCLNSFHYSSFASRELALYRSQFPICIECEPFSLSEGNRLIVCSQQELHFDQLNDQAQARSDLLSSSGISWEYQWQFLWLRWLKKP